MSIQSEATRIINARDDAFDAIGDRGVTVPSGSKIDSLSTYISQIHTENGVGNDVIFFDYDGTEIASYSASAVQNMSSLPQNPTHTGLVSQGWNWTLEQIKTQLVNAPGGQVFVGQMYLTESGATEVDFVLPEERKSPYLRFSLNGTAEVDWGDGSTSTITGNSLTDNISQQHNYASGGAYTIKITIPSGSSGVIMMNPNAHSLLTRNSSTGDENRVYSSTMKAVRIGNNMGLGIHAFRACYNIRYITIPSTVTSFSEAAFRNCYSLKTITVPSGCTSLPKDFAYNGVTLKYVSVPVEVQSVGETAFYTNYSLVGFTFLPGMQLNTNSIFLGNRFKNIVIPNGITSIANNVFQIAYCLESVTLPNGLTKIGNNVFRDVYTLKSINIPSGVTSIGEYAFNSCMIQNINLPSGITTINKYTFATCTALVSVEIPSNVTSIKEGAFSNCCKLTKITIPSLVTSIDTKAFNNCFGFKEIHLLPTTPPTLGNTSAFTLISDCIMYVPYSEDHSILTAYQTATNWSSFVSYMQEEPQS